MQVPLDFLIYLYTPMHYCSKSCDNGSPTAGAQYPSILQTFESFTGYYGDEASTQFVRSDGLEGPGTGQCRLCGGGGSIVPFYGVGEKVEYYEESVRNAVQFCRVPEAIPYSTVEENLVRNGTIGTDGNTYGIVGGVNLDDAGLPYRWKSLSDGTRPAWRYLPQPTSGLATDYCEESRTYTGPTDQSPGLAWDGWVFQGCLGYRDNVTQTLIPYDGELDSCMINNQPEFITACTLEQPSGLSVCVSMSVCPLCLCVCVCVCVNVCLSSVSMCLCMCVSMSVCPLCLCVCVCVCQCLSVLCVYVSVYVCVNVCLSSV